MEGYKGNDATCTKAVQSFVSAWHSELHAQGYVSGVYGSAASTMRDVAALGSAKPDNAWIANWNGVEDVFGDPYVSDALWPNHQRVHQYKGGHKETYGGATINIDSDYVDGAVVGGSAAVPPPPPPAEPPAGSVGSGDGKATATWVAGSFDTTAVVTLTPTTAPPSPTGYGVRLTVTDPATSIAVARFGAPVVVHLLMQTGGLAPSWSVDGAVWKPLRKLSSAALPAGVDAGYTLDPDGTIEIQTLVPGYFGLLPDTTPPSQVQTTARFVKGALRLAWPRGDGQHGRRRELPGAARRDCRVDAAREDAACDRARLPCRADGLPRARGRCVGHPRQGLAPRRRRADGEAARRAAHPAALGVGAARLPARWRTAAEARAEEAAGVVLALGRVAARAVPSQARVTRDPLARL